MDQHPLAPIGAVDILPDGLKRRPGAKACATALVAVLAAVAGAALVLL